MPQPRRSSPGSAPPPRRGEVDAATPVASVAERLALVIGAVPGGSSALAAIGLPAVLSRMTVAQARTIGTQVSLRLAAESRARKNAMRFFLGDVMSRLRPGVTPVEVRQAEAHERAREAEFRTRQRARIRTTIARIGHEADPKRRQHKAEVLIRQEQRYSAMRDGAIARRAAGAANARNVRDTSPEGAVWFLGSAKEHCPGCAFLHGRALTWRALVAANYLPPVGPGCVCELRGIRAAWLSNSTATLRRSPTDAESFALIAQAVELGHPHGHDGGATMIGAR